jgi:uncharacterized protein YigE (DUF2233 family)
MRLLLAILAFAIPASGGEHRRFDLAVAPGGRPATVHAYAFNSQDEVFQVIDQGGIEAQANRDLGAAGTSISALAGVNGGFFNPQGEPLGLMIAGGKQVGTPSLTGSLTSGVVWSDGQESGIARSKSYDLAHPRATNLLQAGPFLIEQAKPVSGLNDKKFARRTVVMTDGGTQWAIAYVPSATLDGLARALAVPGAFPHFQPKTVLNLDGGGSSGLWIKRENGQSFYLHEISKVRNFLVVVRRNKG